MSETPQVTNNPSSPNLTTLFLAAAVVIPLIAVIAFLALRGQNEPSEEVAAPPVSSINTIVIDPPQELTDFTFTSNNGESLSLSDLRGKYVMLYFGFTHCPDFCPTTMVTFKRVKEVLGEDASNIEFILVSVDEERDTPAVLDEFVRRYDAEFIGLQGTETELQRIASDYNLVYEVVPLEGDDYTVDHSIFKFLIDPEGRLIRIYEFNETPQIIADDLRNLMQN